MSDFSLTREEILGALADLDRRLEGQGIVGELCLFGGALMVLAFNAGISTKDVAAYFPADRIPAKTRFLVESLFEEGLA